MQENEIIEKLNLIISKLKDFPDLFNLRLQNNVDRVTKPNDIGAYLFEDGLIKEINYFIFQYLICSCSFKC